MSTYKQIFYHIIFATKHRERTLTDKHQEGLYKYITGLIKDKNCHLYRINGMEDHLHIFSDLHPTITLANYIKDIKLASSDWMKRSGWFPRFTFWQDGYGAFTQSNKERDAIIEYVKHQKEHHKKENFLDEYRRLLKEHDVLFDERYLL